MPLKGNELKTTIFPYVYSKNLYNNLVSESKFYVEVIKNVISKAQYSVDNEKVKRTITKKPSTGINVEEVLTKKGVNTIRAIFEYKFNDKVTPTLTDTLSFKVTVN